MVKKTNIKMLEHLSTFLTLQYTQYDRQHGQLPQSCRKMSKRIERVTNLMLLHIMHIHALLPNQCYSGVATITK